MIIKPIVPHGTESISQRKLLALLLEEQRCQLKAQLQNKIADHVADCVHNENSQAQKSAHGSGVGVETKTTHR